MAFDDEAFSGLLGALDPAMVIVTTADGTERAGCLVGFHCHTSMDPPRYEVRLSKANHTYRVALQASHLAVHLLPDDDQGRKLAEHFGTRSGDDVDKFADLALDSHGGGETGGPPLLAALPHRFVLERMVLLDDGGDHVALVGIPVEATGVDAEELRPLRLSQVDDLTPGHENEERPRSVRAGKHGHGPPKTERVRRRTEAGWASSRRRSR
jgi:flavin reductase (DIM6/NTAB) family NADH-FMN oxidoreductase RutF